MTTRMNDEDGWSEFRKSSFSGLNTCVEIAFSSSGNVRMRNSRAASSAVLEFSADAWTDFLHRVRSGYFGASGIQGDYDLGA